LTTKLPKLHQAITGSYKSRQIVHATLAKDHKKTLCGRAVASAKTLPFDPEAAERVCQRCVSKVAFLQRVHPGWEEVVARSNS